MNQATAKIFSQKPIVQTLNKQYTLRKSNKILRLILQRSYNPPGMGTIKPKRLSIDIEQTNENMETKIPKI